MKNKNGCGFLLINQVLPSHVLPCTWVWSFPSLIAVEEKVQRRVSVRDRAGKAGWMLLSIFPWLCNWILKWICSPSLSISPPSPPLPIKSFWMKKAVLRKYWKYMLKIAFTFFPLKTTESESCWWGFIHGKSQISKSDAVSPHHTLCLCDD